MLSDKTGDQVIVGDLKGTTRIFKLSKGPEIISLYRHTKVNDAANDPDEDLGYLRDKVDSSQDMAEADLNSSPTTKGSNRDSYTFTESSSVVDRVASVSSLAYWERQYSCIFVGYADGLTGQFNATAGAWMRGMKSPRKNRLMVRSIAHRQKTHFQYIIKAIKMLRMLPQYKILLGTTFADKYFDAMGLGNIWQHKDRHDCKFPRIVLHLITRAWPPQRMLSQEANFCL